MKKLIELNKTGEPITSENMKDLNQTYLNKVIKTDGNLLSKDEIEKYLIELDKSYAKKIGNEIFNSDSLTEIQKKIETLNGVFSKAKKIERVNLKEAGKRFCEHIVIIKTIICLIIF